MTSDQKFDAFFDLIQQTARDQGKRFFMDSGEGHTGETASMEMEDLSGWLISPDDEPDFKPAWLHSDVPERFSSDFVFAVWSQDKFGTVSVTFKHYS